MGDWKSVNDRQLDTLLQINGMLYETILMIKEQSVVITRMTELMQRMFDELIEIRGEMTTIKKNTEKM